MTRINVLPVDELSRLHLIAEYRELPRIFNLVRAADARGEIPSDSRNPTCYVLGKGHCRFFYNKLEYLINRQRDIITEMRGRGYDPQFVQTDDLTNGIAQHWFGTYEPDEDALALNRARIVERSGKIDAVDT